MFVRFKEGREVNVRAKVIYSEYTRVEEYIYAVWSHYDP